MMTFPTMYYYTTVIRFDIKRTTLASALSCIVRHSDVKQTGSRKWTETRLDRTWAGAEIKWIPPHLIHVAAADDDDDYKKQQQAARHATPFRRVRGLSRSRRSILRRT